MSDPYASEEAGHLAGQTIRGDDPSWGALAGLLWKLSERWSLGVAVREGPELKAASETFAGPSNTEYEPGELLGFGAGGVVLPASSPSGLLFAPATTALRSVSSGIG